MRGLPCKQIEVDEIWGFIGAKRKNAARAGAYGDVWTFIALDADTKLIPSFLVGKRDAYHAKAFISDLAGRVTKRVQLSSDSLSAYADAVERGFGSEVDYGQISKTYSVINLNKDAASRYSPAEVVSVEKTVVQGMPDVNRISTSHVEKQNHTLRMHCRRLTRLTNAFSKRLRILKLRLRSISRITTSARRMAHCVAPRRRPLAWSKARGQSQNSLNAVANRKEYLDRLRLTVEHLHKCSARYCTTVPVHEKFKGQTVWQGDVEVFDLVDHPKAKRAYGWSHREGKDDKGERFVAVLEIPPVDSAVSAVRIQIVKDVKSGYSK